MRSRKADDFPGLGYLFFRWLEGGVLTPPENLAVTTTPRGGEESPPYSGFSDACPPFT